MVGARVIKVVEWEVIVDDSDYDFVRGLGLSIVRRDDLLHVVINTQPYYKQYLHRVLLNVTNSKIIIDHINHDGLDNRRSNLRKTNKVGNALNMRVNKTKRSGLPKGVYTERDGYRATIQVNGLNKYLGHFTTVDRAVLAYQEAQKKYWNLQME